MAAQKLKLIKGIAPSSFAVTGNLLLAGEVVYLDGAGHWTGDITSAASFAEEAKATQIADEKSATSADEIVGLYVIALGANGLPLSTKEQLRAQGPSNYFHGKQQMGKQQKITAIRGQNVSISDI